MSSPSPASQPAPEQPTSGQPAPGQTAAALAAEEKRAAARMNLQHGRWILMGALAGYLIALFLPQAGQVRGLDIVLRSAVASEAGITVTEYIYATLLFIGFALVALTVATQRAVFGLAAWMLCTVGMCYSIFAMWLRHTRPDNTDGVDLGPGMWLSLLAVIAAFLVFCFLALRRDSRQLELARSRAALEDLDEVGYAQRAALVNHQREAKDNNPLLIDDRRQRAAERHRKL